MPKRITIKIDGEKINIETEGYVGVTCLDDLRALNLPYKVEGESLMPSRGVGVQVGQKTKV